MKALEKKKNISTYECLSGVGLFGVNLFGVTLSSMGLSSGYLFGWSDVDLATLSLNAMNLATVDLVNVDVFDIILTAVDLASVKPSARVFRDMSDIDQHSYSRNSRSRKHEFHYRVSRRSRPRASIQYGFDHV